MSLSFLSCTYTDTDKESTLLFSFTCGFFNLGHSVTAVPCNGEPRLSTGGCVDLPQQGRVHGMANLPLTDGPRSSLLGRYITQPLERGLGQYMHIVCGTKGRIHGSDTAAAACATTGVDRGTL